MKPAPRRSVSPVAGCGWLLSLILLVSLELLTPPLEAHPERDAPPHTDLQGEAVDLSAWRRDFSRRCYFMDERAEPSEHGLRIRDLLDAIARDRVLYDDFVERLQETGAAICLINGSRTARGYYDYAFNVVAIRDDLDFYEQLVILVHELRHVSQIVRGFCPSLDYDMREVARLTFAVEADVQAVTILFSWRMKRAGAPEAWSALLRFENYRDIAEAFRDEMMSSGDERRAARAAFRQWYASQWRIDGYFFNSCMGYLDLLDATKRVQRYDRLPPDFFDELCEVPDLGNYGCHLTDEIMRAPGRHGQQLR